MNRIEKKILIAAAVMITLLMLTPNFIGTTSAKKTVVPFTYTQNVPVPIGTEVDVKWTPDYHLRISRGTYRTQPYEGPLGIGTLYWEAIISITHQDNETVGYTTFHGQGNYREVITITSGPYGTGTLEGMRISNWDFDIARPVPKYIIWGNATYGHGTGDFEGTRMEQSFLIEQYPPPNAYRLETYIGEIIFP